MIEIKKPTKEVLIDHIINSLDQLKNDYPDVKIFMEVPGNVAECKLSDANIYFTMDGRIAIDAE